MHIGNCIVHQVVTQQGSSEVLLNERDTELPVDAPQLPKLLETIRDSYRKESNLAYGDFEEVHTFPEKLEEFEQGRMNFIAFSKRAMSELKSRMESEPLSTGGYVLFAYYQDGGTNYLMIVMLKDAAGLSFNDDLDLLNIHHLDLDKLHFAARVNFRTWQSGGQRCISFLKGRSRADVTVYFKRFLGIDESTYQDERDNTRLLKKAISEYCQAQDFSVATENVIRLRVRDYGLQQLDAHQPAGLRAIANMVDPENPERFVLFANDDQVNLPGDIPLSRQELRRFTRFNGRDKLINITFEQEALEKDRVHWDHNDTLTIKGIPDKLKESLKSYYHDDRTGSA